MDAYMHMLEYQRERRKEIEERTEIEEHTKFNTPELNPSRTLYRPLGSTSTGLDSCSFVEV